MDDSLLFRLTIFEGSGPRRSCGQVTRMDGNEILAVPLGSVAWKLGFCSVKDGQDSIRPFCLHVEHLPGNRVRIDGAWLAFSLSPFLPSSDCVRGKCTVTSAII